MWTCTLIIAGITVLPARSTRAAPAGALTSPCRPTEVMRPLSTTTALFSMTGLRSPGISRAPSNTTTRDVGVWLESEIDASSVTMNVDVLHIHASFAEVRLKADATASRRNTPHHAHLRGRRFADTARMVTCRR